MSYNNTRLSRTEVRSGIPTRAASTAPHYSHGTAAGEYQAVGRAAYDRLHRAAAAPPSTYAAPARNTMATSPMLPYSHGVGGHVRALAGADFNHNRDPVTARSTPAAATSAAAMALYQSDSIISWDTQARVAAAAPRDPRLAPHMSSTSTTYAGSPAPADPIRHRAVPASTEEVMRDEHAAVTPHSGPDASSQRVAQLESMLQEREAEIATLRQQIFASGSSTGTCVTFMTGGDWRAETEGMCGAALDILDTDERDGDVDILTIYRRAFERRGGAAMGTRACAVAMNRLISMAVQVATSAFEAKRALIARIYGSPVPSNGASTLPGAAAAAPVTARGAAAGAAASAGGARDVNLALEEMPSFKSSYRGFLEHTFDTAFAWGSMTQGIIEKWVDEQSAVLGRDVGNLTLLRNEPASRSSRVFLRLRTYVHKLLRIVMWPLVANVDKTIGVADSVAAGDVRLITPAESAAGQREVETAKYTHAFIISPVLRRRPLERSGLFTDPSISAPSTVEMSDPKVKILVLAAAPDDLTVSRGSPAPRPPSAARDTRQMATAEIKYTQPTTVTRSAAAAAAVRHGMDEMRIDLSAVPVRHSSVVLEDHRGRQAVQSAASGVRARSTEGASRSAAGAAARSSVLLTRARW